MPYVRNWRRKLIRHIKYPRTLKLITLLLSKQPAIINIAKFLPCAFLWTVINLDSRPLFLAQTDLSESV